MKSNRMLRAIVLLVLLISLIPIGVVSASPSADAPPENFFQLPWDQGIAWYAIDGIDNGSKRPLSSSHNHRVGGAIDFAPKKYMFRGEDTSNYWVAAAGPGTVVGLSTCHVIIDHGNGWITQYQFLAKVQVNLGDHVERNQRLGIIADGVRYPFCVGSIEPDIPHLHFMLRPTLIGSTFAGWNINYYSFFSSTTFTKNNITVGLYQPLMNMFETIATPTFTPTPISPTPTEITPTPAGPHVSTTVDKPNINVGETALVTVNLNNIPSEGYTSAELTCTYDPAVLEVSNITTTELFGPDPAVAINGPQNGSFIVAIAGTRGNKATSDGPAFSFNVKGLQPGQTIIECKVRVSTGNGQLMELPSIGTVLNVLGDSPTATPSPTATMPPSTVTPTPTSPIDGWLIFTNLAYGFEFKYPSQGQIVNGGNDNFTRINLPFTSGTNLTEKYLEVIVAESVDPCQSPLATQSMLEKSETVVVNGIQFLKQTGQDGTAGHTNKWTAFSTLRNNVCVSLDFILRAANPGVFDPPPPLYDETAESSVFGQIVETYTWLVQAPTSTPTPAQNGTIAGQVDSPKPVILELYGINGSLLGSATVEPNVTFTLTAPGGTYKVVASSSGFLSAEATAAITNGETITLVSVTLPAGDIDGNNVIDQFDALTIGMNYNAAEPSIADLNNDGVINVLDLEALARNYRKTGPIVWQ